MSAFDRKQVPQILALAAIFLILVTTLVAVWAQLADDERLALARVLNEHAALILTAAFLFPFGFALATHWVFRRYVEPLRRLVDDVKVMNAVDSSRRLTPEGNRHLMELASAINQSADLIKSLRQNVDQHVRKSQREMEKERNILATLVDEFANGVIVCNREGQILLYNKRSRELLGETGDNGPAPSVVGLGRSIFEVINKSLLTQSLAQMDQRKKDDHTDRRIHFITTGMHGTLLRTEIVPIESPHEGGQEISPGFVLLINDISRQVVQDSHRDAFLEETFRKIRSAVANIRAGIEVLSEYPGIDPTKREQFFTAIRDESVALSGHIDQGVEKHARDFSNPWPLEETPCLEVLMALKRVAEQSLDVRISLGDCRRELMAMSDNYMVLQALLFVMDEIKKATGVTTFMCMASEQDRFVSFDLCWNGKPLPSATLREWESRQLKVEGHEIPVTLNDVLHRHNAEIWSQATSETGACIRVLLPSAEMIKSRPAWQVQSSVQSRPEFYDFDLFKLPGQLLPENRPLAGLSYTAFDLETTGLRPSGGDEIISIGGVRIVNGRLLQSETFNQLVDPQRSVPPESFNVHGIGESLLKGQPLITAVLPLFSRFVEGTVLVGHNVGFDMQFLHMKQESTGIKLENPVLDTLLLSAIVHPHHNDHNLEAIADRLGVNIVGRHTALGDAFLTGEIFIRLIPLLLDKGIRSLSEALEASKKTYYARLKY